MSILAYKPPHYTATATAAYTAQYVRRSFGAVSRVYSLNCESETESETEENFLLWSSADDCMFACAVNILTSHFIPYSTVQHSAV